MNENFKELISREELDKRLTELAEQIDKDYLGKELTIICVMRGAVFFTVELTLKMKTKVKYEFITVSSYEGTETTGEVTITGVGQTEILATASETEFYKQIGICYKLNVNKANYDTSKIKFENMSVPFDGKSHSIAAYGLPAGVKVT